MKFLSKIVAVLIVLGMMTCHIEATSLPPNPESLSCYSAVLVEPVSGKVLYDKNGDQRIYPASTTKIVTAMLAFENLDLDKNLTVPDDFPFVDGSSMYLLPTETFTVRELIEAVLIHSANDAAYLLGLEMSGGDMDKFVTMMNDRVSELGCTNTHFANPHGMHNDNHFSTARDMAMIASEAMKNEGFCEMVKRPALSLHETDKTPEKRMYYSTNRFLWSQSPMIYKEQYIPIKYDIIDGVKTGYTTEAGNCLISSATKDDMKLISAVYKSSGFEVYKDSRILIDYGYDNYDVKKLLFKGRSLGKKKVKFSVQKELDYALNQDVYHVVNKGEDVGFTSDIKFDDIKLPVKKGQKVGVATVTIASEKQNYDVVALNEVESIFTVKHLKETVLGLPKYLTKKNIAIGIGIIIVIMLFKRHLKRRRRRYRRYRRY